MTAPRSSSSSLSPPIHGDADMSASAATVQSPLSGLVWGLPTNLLKDLATEVDVDKTTQAGLISADGIRLNGFTWALGCTPVKSKREPGKLVCGVSLRCRVKTTSATVAPPGAPATLLASIAANAPLPSVSLDVRVSLGNTVVAIREPNSSTPGLFSFEFILDEGQLGAQVVEMWILVRVSGSESAGTGSEPLAKHEAMLYVFGDSITGVRRMPTDNIGALLMDDPRTGDVQLCAEGGSMWAHTKVLENGWEFFKGLKIEPQQQVQASPIATVNGTAGATEKPSEPATPESAPSTPPAYSTSSSMTPRATNKVTLPISIDTLKIIVGYIYLGKLPTFAPDDKGVEGACNLYSALVAYPLPRLFPLACSLITSAPLLTPLTACPLLIRLESTPLRPQLISFVSSQFSAVVKTTGWNDLVFKKAGVPRDGKEGEENALKLREDTVKQIMEEVGQRV